MQKKWHWNIHRRSKLERKNFSILPTKDGVILKLINNLAKLKCCLLCV